MTIMHWVASFAVLLLITGNLCVIVGLLMGGSAGAGVDEPEEDGGTSRKEGLYVLQCEVIGHPDRTSKGTGPGMPFKYAAVYAADFNRKHPENHYSVVPDPSRGETQ